METEKFAQVVVIGAGPGGYAAAFRAADLGKKVLLIDRDPTLGGVCLNRGCIPSKALLHIAKVIHDASSLAALGVTFGDPQIDIEAIRNYKNVIVTKMNDGIAQMARARQVETMQGSASFQSDSEIRVTRGSDTVKVTFDNCIIAGGSSSAMLPGIPVDDPGVLTSRTALDIADIPQSLLVIGGGIIGLELGQVYAALGTQVSVVEFLPHLIPGADRDLVKPLEHRLKKQFQEIRVSSKVTEVKRKKQGRLQVTIESDLDSHQETYDKVLVAVGRKPNTELLNLEKTTVTMDGQGFITADVYQRTSVPNIFAIGDIIGNPMLAHKATHEGKVAAEVICGLPAVFDARAIPSVIYTHPEVAWSGLTEMEAQEQGIAYEKGEFPWAASGRGQAVGAIQGKTKILFNPNTKKTLGIGMVGPGAGDMISEGTLAIELGADAEDISLTVHPHPTLSETLAFSAEVFEGTVTDLYLPGKEKGFK